MEKMYPSMIKLILCTWEFGYFLDICKVWNKWKNTFLCILGSDRPIRIPLGVLLFWEMLMRFNFWFLKEYCDSNDEATTAESKEDGKVRTTVINCCHEWQACCVHISEMCDCAEHVFCEHVVDLCFSHATRSTSESVLVLEYIYTMMSRLLLYCALCVGCCCLLLIW